MAAEAEPGAAPAGHVRWRRRLLIAVLLVLGVLVFEHRFGGRVTAMSGLALGGLLLAGFVIWRLPHLRRHFGNPNKGSLNFPNQRMARQRGHRLQFRGPGGGGTASRRRSGSGSGSRSGGLPKAFRRGGSGSGSRSGPGRRGGSGSGRRGSLMRPHRSSAVSPARANPAGRRKGGAGSGSSRGKSGGLRRGSGSSSSRSRRGSAGGGSRGRSSAGRGRSGGLLRRGSAGSSRGRGPGGSPSKGRRFAGASRGRRGLVPASRKSGGGGTGTRRRIVPGWRRKGRAGTGTGPGRKGATGGGSTSSPKRRTMPWRRTGTGPGRNAPGRTSSRKRLAVPWRRNRAAGGTTLGRPSRRHPVRRARWQRQHAGKPQRFKAARFRARRVRARAVRNWRAARGHAGGSFPRPAGMNALRRRWRIRQGKTVPGGWTRNEQRRLARRRALMRLPRRQRIRNRLARLTQRRHRPPPRPLARGGKHRGGRRVLNSLAGRADRWRTRRWIRNTRRRRSAAPPPARTPARTVPASRPGAPLDASPNGSSSAAGSNSPGGKSVANVHDAADQISEMIRNWMDANDLDQTLEDLHEIPRAIEGAFSRYAEQLSEDTNLKESIPEAVREAAAAMAGIADELQQEIRFGVQQS